MKHRTEVKSLSKSKQEKVDKIQLQWSKKEGRFGIAKNEIKCGEIVLADEPTIAFPHVISNTHCDFCLSREDINSEGRAYKKCVNFYAFIKLKEFQSCQ